MPENIASRLKAHPQWTLALLTLILLLPFAGKPFNMDDPLFLWAAHQIQAHPADPYGFNVEWNWHQSPMWKVTENPPLAAYYIALVARGIGWSEVALHLAFLLPALAAILGTFRLARHLCSWPMTATLAILFTPAFLVSSTTIMCDVPMLAFWVWAVVLWIEGLEKNNSPRLLAAVCLITLAELTKYYGLSLIPLLGAYGIFAKRRVGKWALFFLIPLTVACAYEWAMYHLYGTHILLGAVNYGVAKEGNHFTFGLSSLIGLGFTGACLASILFFTPFLWRKIIWIVATLVVSTLAAFLLSPGLFEKYPLLLPRVHVATEIQLALWAATGISVLTLAIVDFVACRDAKSLMLLLWIAGTFIFAAYLNWTVNARSILPMAPAVGILIARRLEKNAPALWKLASSLAACAVLTLFVIQADYLQAVAIRQNVRAIHAAYGQVTTPIWFEGHWGFQYYMSTSGATPLDFMHAQLNPGDLVVTPSNNTNVLPASPDKTRPLQTCSQSGSPWLATVSQPLGACFYASVMGPLPFAFGSAPPETASVYVLH